MNTNFLRRNAHTLLGTLLLTGFTGAAAALYYEVPLTLRQMYARASAAQTCPHHGSADAVCPSSGSEKDHAHAKPAGHSDGGCCKDKQTTGTPPAAGSMTLPPGHPPVPGFTVATEGLVQE